MPRTPLPFLVTASLAALAGCTAIHPRVPPPISAHTTVTNFDYSPYRNVLEKYVNTRGRVDYAALQKNPHDLDTFYAQIAAISPDSHPLLFPLRKHKLAYWINAYNATVLRTVLEYYPLESVTDVQPPPPLRFLPDKSGFFLLQRLTYGGASTSFYYLENKVIRKRFSDPRIHFALNCASSSCPELPRTPFLPATLNDQLEFETRKFINDPRNLRIDPGTNTLSLSSIFQWYETDFTGSPVPGHPQAPATLAEYITPYLDAANRTKLQNLGPNFHTTFLPYDWSLNAALH